MKISIIQREEYLIPMMVDFDRKEEQVARLHQDLYTKHPHDK